MASLYDLTIIGGGIVGLATALKILEAYPRTKLLILEKEAQLARHQTGNNSGVIHSGIYYKPGSLKVTFAREGSRSMVGFCRGHGLKHEVCGKVIVATKRADLTLLDRLYRRGLDHRLSCYAARARTSAGD